MRTIAAQVVGCTACTFPKTLQAAITSRPSLSTINTAALPCTSGNLFILASARFQIARTPGQRRSVFALSLWTLSVSLLQRMATLLSLQVDCHRIDGEKDCTETAWDAADSGDKKITASTLESLRRLQRREENLNISDSQAESS